MVRVLLTNDDGIYSDGLHQLELTLREIGDIFVVAPSSEMSGAAHSLTLSRPLRIRQIDERHWTVDGTPTDCVTLALNEILPPELRPDICASGINYGPNLGDDVTYSGTVSGALEATILGVPGLAFSLVARENFNFKPAARIAAKITRKVLEEGLPEGTLLNVNIPNGDFKGVRLTAQGLKNARPVIVKQNDPRGKPYYWIGEERLGFHPGDNTDFEAVEKGFVSVTPLRSDMTNHRAFEAMKHWNTFDF
jgi:5'-nucleotidase